MLKFLGKLGLFLLPIIGIFSVPLYVYVEGGEFTTVDQVLNAQRNSYGTLFSLAYNSVNSDYKLDLVRTYNPAVIALGSSRVHQFRNFFFDVPFENASNGVVTLADMKRFVESLPQDSNTKVIILGLDQRYFDPAFALPSETQQASTLERFEAFLGGNWKRVYGDYLTGKFTLAQLQSARATSSAIGVLALVNDNGFLADGSYYDGKAMRDPSRLTMLEETRAGSAQYDGTASAASSAALKDFLATCAARGIHVVAFLPPYLAPSDTHYEPTLANSLKSTLQSFGYPFFDYTDGSVVGIKDSEYVDALHATDKAYARILIDIASKDAVVRRDIDVNALATLLRNNPGDFLYVRQ